MSRFGEEYKFPDEQEQKDQVDDEIELEIEDDPRSKTGTKTRFPRKLKRSCTTMSWKTTRPK